MVVITISVSCSPSVKLFGRIASAFFVLETKDLGISFGGLKAVENVDLKIKKKQLYGLVGPNGAGKTTVFNMLTGVYQPTTGTFYLNGEELRGKSQEQINHKGIARTFQNIRLFNNMSVIRNVLVGLHNQPEFKCDIFSSIFRLPKHYKSGKYDVVILNFANCDMVGHTGVFDAAVKAVEAVDTAVDQVVSAVLNAGGCAFITADHGVPKR